MALQQGKKFLTNNPDSKLSVLLEQADTLVTHVGQLKGAAMKAIQTLSVEGYDFLPPEVLQVLEKLQSQAPPVDAEVLFEVMQEQLGAEKLSRLENISKEPMASASIGQVFTASLDGQPVVIKVQYPGVAESVDADINTLKKLLKGFLVINNKKVDLDELMEEVRRVLKLETDYKNEAIMLKRYRALFGSSSYVLPRVYEDFISDKVLVMSREEGLEFPRWLAGNPSEEARQQVAVELLNLYIKEFFENQLVQTDPNPANFLINKNNQLVLLDFGATLEFEMEFVKNYQTLVRKVFSGDRKEILDQVYTMGFLDRRESSDVQEHFVDFLQLSMKPFEPEIQPFDFSQAEYSFEVRSQALSFSRKLKYSSPPKKLIFLHRKLGGIFMLLRRLEVQMDLSPYRDLILKKDFY